MWDGRGKLRISNTLSPTPRPMRQRGQDTHLNRPAHLMDNTTFGLTMLLVGMGGTLITLGILAVLIGWLTRLCQPRVEGGKHE